MYPKFHVATPLCWEIPENLVGHVLCLTATTIVYGYSIEPYPGRWSKLSPDHEKKTPGTQGTWTTVEIWFR